MQHTSSALEAAISQLEHRQAAEGKILKEQFHYAFESVRPINLIKNTFKEAVESQDIQNNILNTSVGLVAGYLSKTLFEGVSHSPFKKLLGAALLFGITNVVAKNPEVVKAVGMSVFRMIRGNSREKRRQNSLNGAKEHAS